MEIEIRSGTITITPIKREESHNEAIEIKIGAIHKKSTHEYLIIKFNFERYYAEKNEEGEENPLLELSIGKNIVEVDLNELLEKIQEIKEKENKAKIKLAKI